jgi:hypothetical protein
MNNQSAMRMSFLTFAMCTLFCGLVMMQNMWVYAQGNLSQVLNQTSNQTSNQTFVQGKPLLNPPYPECFMDTTGDGYLFDLFQCSDNGSVVKYDADKNYYGKNGLCILDNQDNIIVYPSGKNC